MAYPHAIVRLTFGGKIYKDEIWSNSLHLGRPGTAAGDGSGKDKTSTVNGVRDALNTWFHSVEAGISQEATLEWFKIAVIGADGKYINDALVFDYDTPVTGGYSSSSMDCAPQNTLVLTLTTGSSRGLAKMGRIYPPLNAHPGSSNGRDTTANAQMNAFVSLLQELNAVFLDEAAFGSIEVVVASNVREGKISPVTGVKVGDVIDTQRSRRNALRENYVTKSLTLPDNFDNSGGNA